MRARAYLDAEVRHISGVVANGISLRVNVTPRFKRLETVADIAFNLARTSYYPSLENELNDNYACEGLSLKISPTSVIVYDTFAGEVVIT